MGRYPTPSGDGLMPLMRDLSEIRRRLSELEQPTGTSMNSLVAQVQEAIANINATVTAAIAANSYTKTQIDSKIASPGNINPANVSASGSISASGGLTVSGEVRMPNVPVTILTSAYFATYGSTNDGGRMGHVPSSRRFKQDIAPAALEPDQLLALQLVTFRYIEAVNELGDDADTEIGLIAEDVHDLGMTWLVYYDSDGQPVGIRYERLALALLPTVQSLHADVAAIKIRLGL